MPGSQSAPAGRPSMKEFRTAAERNPQARPPRLDAAARVRIMVFRKLLERAEIVAAGR